MSSGHMWMAFLAFSSLFPFPKKIPVSQPVAVWEGLNTILTLIVGFDEDKLIISSI